MAQSAFGVEHGEVSKAFKMPGFAAGAQKKISGGLTALGNKTAAGTTRLGMGIAQRSTGPAARGAMGNGFRANAQMRAGQAGMKAGSALGVAGRKMGANPMRTGAAVAGTAAGGAAGVPAYNARKNKQPGRF